MRTQLGFYVPWQQDDAAHIACALADFALTGGYQPSVYSNVPLQLPFHHRWDFVAQATRPLNPYDWLRRCSNIVWLEIDPAKVAKAKKLGCRNHLFVLWHTLTPENLPHVTDYDTIICPTHSVYRWLQRRIGDNVKMVLMPWHPGPRLVKHRGKTEPKATSIYLPLDSYTVNKLGNELFYSLRLVMEQFKDLELRISYQRTMPRFTKIQAVKLWQDYESRVNMLKRPTWAQRVRFIESADWTLTLTLRDNVGLTVLDSLVRGRPVIALDSPPAADFLRMDYSAELLSCDIEHNDIGVPEAKPDVGMIFRGLCDILSNDDRLFFLQNNSWEELDDARVTFIKQWQELLK